MNTAAVTQPPEHQQRPDHGRSHQLRGFGLKEVSSRLKTCRKLQVRQSKGLKGEELTMQWMSVTPPALPQNFP